MKTLLRLLSLPFKAVAFVVLLFYEWGWEPLSRAVAKLVRFRWMRWTERKVQRAPPWVALLLFLTPTLVLLPFKLAAFWLIAHGKKLLGVGIIVLAKVVGTAVVAWIFKNTHETLMRLHWFAWIYTRVVAWKTRWLTWMRNTAAWQAAKAMRARVSALIAPLRARFRAWRAR